VADRNVPTANRQNKISALVGYHWLNVAAGNPKESMGLDALNLRFQIRNRVLQIIQEKPFANGGPTPAPAGENNWQTTLLRALSSQ
jgi:hypothetical protein